MADLHFALPGDDISTEYYDCRFKVLREPLGFERGAELLHDDSEAIHVWAVEEGIVIGVGRAHLLANDQDGSGADIPGKNSASAPPFGPLKNGGPQFRPAIQIRQMGTREGYRRRGIAGLILSKLEELSSIYFEATFGFLQAREVAYDFYESQGWEKIDSEYTIQKIGPHNSMMKKLNKT